MFYMDYHPYKKIDYAYDAAAVYLALKEKRKTGIKNFFRVWRISRKPAVANCDIDMKFGYSSQENVTYYDECGSRSATIERFGDPIYSYKYNTEFQCHPCSIGSYLKKCKKKMNCFPDNGEIYLNDKDSKFLMEGFTPTRIHNSRTHKTHIVSSSKPSSETSTETTSNENTKRRDHNEKNRKSFSTFSTHRVTNHDGPMRNIHHDGPMRSIHHDGPMRSIGVTNHSHYYHPQFQPRFAAVPPPQMTMAHHHYPIYQQVPFSSRNYNHQYHSFY